jgi:chromosome partitioning protein
MPTIVFISPKGGVGKTTSSLVLATQFAKRGYPTTIIDADPNRPQVAWSKGGGTDYLNIVGEVDEDSIIDVIDTAAAASSVVIVDLEGSAGKVALLAVSQADLVLIPMQASELDAAQASKALRVIRDFHRMSNRTVPHAILFTRTSGAIITKTMRSICDNLRKAGVQVMTTDLWEREAFKLMFSYNQTLEQLDLKVAPSRDKAIANAEKFMAEVASMVAQEGGEAWLSA